MNSNIRLSKYVCVTSSDFLMNITNHGNLTSKIVTYGTAIIGLLIALVVIFAFFTAWRRYDRNNKRKGYPQVRINFQSLLTSQNLDNSDTSTFDNAEMDERNRKLTVTETEKTSEKMIDLKV